MRYEYDIDIIKQLRDAGLSWESVAKETGTTKKALYQWVQRNYTEKIIHIYQKK
jgi:lambda repressor-like predicted transcriptional regulator